ncbi:hypothetical protein Dsin_020686 [Dipteronia sinensis]|uniref:Fe2OG dioxygenase domain-containing protein n=1 Tax=Dipteronia sinensis TaxID=43782 RepID=A0AAE0A9Q3_9ROSI|nr:hypothetical protein Dsin_020686 [Dipteronia sinensis]
METKTRLLGSSLAVAVPFVQELAKKPLINIPPRYVRPDQDPLESLNSSSSSQIPVIDMQKLLSHDFVDSELQKLHQACKEWGFFQLINHEVSGWLVEKFKSEIEDFFKLPIEEKNKYSQLPGDIEGYGHNFVVSEEQKLDWGDMFHLTTLPTHLRKPHLLPNLPLSFRETLEAYSTELKILSTKILKLMAKGLRIEENEMAVLVEEEWQSMRMNYYPPCPQPELVVGLCPHSDGSGITILLQVSEVEGLQIRKDGMWISVKPLSNAFIINVGDSLEILSNGTYRSVEHRATVNSLKERLSVATFCSPRLDGEIGPAPSLVTQETPAKFRRIRVEEFYKGRFSRKLDRKSYLDTIRIQNEEGGRKQ